MNSEKIMAGAPKGNNNANKNNRLWADSIRRELIQGDGKKMRAIAKKLVAMAEAGDMSAIREIGDRIDGKAIQAIEGTGEGGAIMFQSITRQIVKAK